jgi:hypothetical protein
MYLDDRDQFAAMEDDLAEYNQDTRDSVRGKNNYQPIQELGAHNGYWPSQWSADSAHRMTERFIQEDAFDPS